LLVFSALVTTNISHAFSPICPFWCSPQSLAFVGCSYDVAGAATPINTISMTSGTFAIRSTASFMGMVGNTLTIKNVTLQTGYFTVDHPMTIQVGILNGSTNSQVNIGVSTKTINNPVLIADYIRVQGTGSAAALNVWHNTSVTTKLLYIEGSLPNFGDNVRLTVSHMQLSNTKPAVIGDNFVVNAVATPAAQIPAWAAPGGWSLTGGIGIRNVATITSSSNVTIVANGTVNFGVGTTSWKAGGTVSIRAATVLIETGFTIDSTGGGYTTALQGPGTGVYCGSYCSQPGGAHGGCGARSSATCGGSNGNPYGESPLGLVLFHWQLARTSTRALCASCVTPLHHSCSQVRRLHPR